MAGDPLDTGDLCGGMEGSLRIRLYLDSTVIMDVEKRNYDLFPLVLWKSRHQLVTSHPGWHGVESEVGCLPRTGVSRRK
jgi:hypothetical protein